MSSVRNRVSSLFRRSSVISDKDRDSASEREISRPPSREGSLRKQSGEGKRRKRLSFSMRGRSGTADTQEQSQLAKSVVSAAEFGDKSAVAVVDFATESAPTYNKTDSPVDSVDARKVEVKEEPEENTVESTEAVSQQVPAEAPVVGLPEEAPVVALEVPVIEVTDEVKPSDLHEAAQVTDASNTESNVKTGEAPFDIVMKDSPSHSMIEVEKRVVITETAPYDTSFASSSSGAGPISPPLSLPIPSRPIGQPLSAIDELRAKGHPLAEWAPKDDVNYDADEEENKPLLDNSILTEVNTESHRPIRDSTLSLRTNGLDTKSKAREPTPIFETLGWTEYTLPDGTIYYALHMSSPASPQHLKMPTPITASPIVTVIADFDLRNPIMLKRICEEMRVLIKSEMPASSNPWTSESGSWELWLHRPTGFEPQKFDAARPPIVHTWINQLHRVLSPRPHGAVDLPPRMDGDSITLVDGAAEGNDREKLVKELGYWSFIEKHPAHGALAPDARREALEALTWSYADRLSQNDKPTHSPFSQEECQALLRMLDGYNASGLEQDRRTSNRIIASIHSRILNYRIATVDAAKGIKLANSTGNNLDQKGRLSTVTFPFRRATIGFICAIICWGIPYLFTVDSDPFARFKPHHGQIIDQSGTTMWYTLESSNVVAERRNNAMIYGAGVGVTAAVMVGSATTLLTMRPPLGTPARTASFVALLFAGASLAASLISLARMSRGPQNTSYATYSPGSDLLFPAVKRDAESQMVLNVRASFTPPFASPKPLPPRGQSGVPFPWFF